MKPKPSEVLPAKCRLSEEIRRAQVIEAAIRLFAQRGFQGTTTKQIAEEAGINEALIFRYFHSKQELYSAILDYGTSQVSTERWIEELQPYAERRDDEGLFSGLAHRLIENHALKESFWRLTLYSALEKHELARMCRARQGAPLEDFLTNYIRTRQCDGAFTGLDARTVALSFIGMCSHHVMLSILFGTECSGITNGQAEETFARVFLEGLRTSQTKSKSGRRSSVQESIGSKGQL